MSFGSLEFGFRVLVTLWLLAVSVWDFFTRRIPNWLVLPIALLAMGWRIYEAAVRGALEGLAFSLGAWAVLYTMWRAHVFGGGDAKFLMALFAMFPTAHFLLVFSLAVLAVSIPIVIVQYIKSRLRDLGDGRWYRRSRQDLLPTAEALRSKGQPFSWTFALPGVIYLWLRPF